MCTATEKHWTPDLTDRHGINVVFLVRPSGIVCIVANSYRSRSLQITEYSLLFGAWGCDAGYSKEKNSNSEDVEIS